MVLPKWLVAMSLNEFSGQIETTYANGKKQTLSHNVVYTPHH
jgi:hypothetical protein